MAAKREREREKERERGRAKDYQVGGNEREKVREKISESEENFRRCKFRVKKESHHYRNNIQQILSAVSERERERERERGSNVDA